MLKHGSDYASALYCKSENALAHLSENVDGAERHERLACAALGDDARCFGLAKILRHAGDGERLGRERLT